MELKVFTNNIEAGNGSCMGAVGNLFFIAPNGSQVRTVPNKY